MSEEVKSCSRCIHRKVCVARDSYDGVSKTWNEQYPYVKMNEDGDTLALDCSEYKTLSDIHMIKKTDTEKEKKGIQGYHQSQTYKEIGKKT